MISSLAPLVPGRLSSLIYFITSLCNARCVHCFNHGNLNRNVDQELNIHEINRISQKLGRLLIVQISGGEPFLKADHHEILSAFAPVTSAITITTNGFLTEQIEDTMRRLTDRHKKTLFRVSFSIDGVGDLHDRIRNFPGGFERVTDTFSRLRKIRDKNPNMLLTVTTTFSRANERDMKAIIDYVHQLGTNYHTISYLWGDSQDESVRNPSLELYKNSLVYMHGKDYASGKMGISARFARILHRITDFTMIEILERGKMLYPCQAIRKFAILAADGEVNACHMIQQSLGNVREHEYDVRDILRNASSEKLGKKIRDSKCVCSVTCVNRHNALFSPRTALYFMKYLRNNKMAL